MKVRNEGLVNKTDRAEFAVYDGDDFYAEVEGPREIAWGEAMNYASQVEEPRIEEVTRRPVPMGELPPDCPPQWNAQLCGCGPSSHAIFCEKQSGKVCRWENIYYGPAKSQSGKRP